MRNIESSDIFGKKAIKTLKSLNLRACYKQGIDGYIRLVKVLNGLIEEITETIHSSGGKTIPAVSLGSWLTI